MHSTIVYYAENTINLLTAVLNRQLVSLVPFLEIFCVYNVIDDIIREKGVCQIEQPPIWHFFLPR